MSDEASAPVGGEVVSTTPASTPASTTSLTVREAHEAYTARKEEESKAPAKAKVPAVETEELAPQANADPAEQAPGEVTEAVEPAEKPLIEPPRSWTKEAKERWSALPPETQEYLAEREQERDREVRRSQNEAADKLKGLTAKEQEVERVRQEYEAKLPAIMQMLQNKGEFADIRTMDDVRRMAAEDPFRKIQWDAYQQELQAVAYEAQQAEQRQSQEQSTKWAEHVQKENALVAEKLPDFANPEKAKALQTKAVERLNDLGFTQGELAELASGKSKLSIYDHRIQLLIADSLKLADVQSAKAVAVAKPVPQVQRPGVAQPKGAAADANVQALSQRLNSTGSVKDAFALYQAKKKVG